VSRDFLNELGDTLFNTVFGILNAGISGLTFGIVEDYLGTYSSLDEFLSSIATNAGELIIDLIGQTGTEIETLVGDTYWQISRSTLEILGLVDESGSILTELENTMAQRVDDWGEQLRRDLDRQEDAASALGTEAIDVLEDERGRSLLATELYMDQLEERLGEDAFENLSLTIGSFDAVKQTFSVSFDELLRQATRGSVEATDSLVVIAQNQIEEFDTYFRETVAKPIAMGENIGLALIASTQHESELLPTMINAALIAAVEGTLSVNYEEIFRRAAEQWPES